MKEASILVIVEMTDGHPNNLAYEMLGRTRELADQSGGTVLACVLGCGLDGVGNHLITHGADRAYLVDAGHLAEYQADAWLPDLVNVVRQARPDAAMIGHTPLGADLAPRLAFRLGTTIATSCINVSINDGKLLLTRPCYGGKANEVVSIVTSPAVFTVKPKSFAPRQPRDDRSGEIVRVDSVLDAANVRTKVREVRRAGGDDARLESANIVVAGGGGMKGPHGFEVVARLAELLGGAVGASRVACDLGWCPPSYQVGLSGKTVAPELYVAIGISGAGQHMAGCANAKTIVAINTDPDAPIFKFATFGVIGDCHALMPALIEQIEARRR